MAPPLKPLQSVAVHVTEPEAGAFQWALTKLEADHTWSELQSADTTRPTYKEAMAEGLLALQARISDLNAGPRADATERHGPTPRHGPRDATEVEPAAGSDSDPESRTEPTRRSVFGFGLAN